MKTNEDTTTPAGGSPIGRGVKRLEPEHEYSDAWLIARATSTSHLLLSMPAALRGALVVAVAVLPALPMAASHEPPNGPVDLRQA